MHLRNLTVLSVCALHASAVLRIRPDLGPIIFDMSIMAHAFLSVSHVGPLHTHMQLEWVYDKDLAFPMVEEALAKQACRSVLPHNSCSQMLHAVLAQARG